MPPASQPPDVAAFAIEGHAIVTADGMIAAPDGTMPVALRNEADWRRFQAALDASVLVVLGRLGHRRHPNPGRPRLVFTSGVPRLSPDPDDPFALLFNPAGASLATALTHFGLSSGTLAVTGGTRVFDYFLPLYQSFSLAEINGMALPEGRPCFAAGHPRTILAAAGLKPHRFELIDAAVGVSLTRWTREPAPR